MWVSAVKRAERLNAEGTAASVGSKDDSDDIVMTNALSSLFSAELVPNKGPWRGIKHLEDAVTE